GRSPTRCRYRDAGDGVAARAARRHGSGRRPATSRASRRGHRRARPRAVAPRGRRARRSLSELVGGFDERSAVPTASDLPPNPLGRQPLDQPAAAVTPIAKAVVQAVLAVSPELERHRNEAKAAPLWRQRHVASLELTFEL